MLRPAFSRRRDWRRADRIDAIVWRSLVIEFTPLFVASLQVCVVHTDFGLRIDRVPRSPTGRLGGRPLRLQPHPPSCNSHFCAKARIAYFVITFPGCISADAAIAIDLCVTAAVRMCACVRLRLYYVHVAHVGRAGCAARAARVLKLHWRVMPLCTCLLAAAIARKDSYRHLTIIITRFASPSSPVFFAWQPIFWFFVPIYLKVWLAPMPPSVPVVPILVFLGLSLSH